MATIEQRLAALEAKKIRNPDLATWTDEELLDFIGFPDGATNEQLLAIIQDKGANHANN